MSSLQEKKALALIAVAHGAALSIGKNYNLGPTFAGKVSALAELLKQAGKQWPVSGGDSDVSAWVLDKLSRWSQAQGQINGEWRICGLANIALHAVTDLDERAAKKFRQTGHDKYFAQMELLLPVIDALVEIIEELGDQGNEQAAMTDDLVKELYKIMGGEWRMAA